MSTQSFLIKKRDFILMNISALLSSACNQTPSIPPVEVPFGLGVGNERAEFNFKVEKPQKYIIRLKIYFQNSEDAYQRKSVISLLGDRFAIDHSINNIGVPIALRIRVKSINVQGPPVTFDHSTNRLGFVYAAEEFAIKEVQTSINDQKLQAGIYHIRVDNLTPVQDFKNFKVNLILLPAWTGK